MSYKNLSELLEIKKSLLRHFSVLLCLLLATCYGPAFKRGEPFQLIKICTAPCFNLTLS